MSVVWMMDVELFKKLYLLGMSYEKMSRELHVSLLTIRKYRKQLNLSTREYKQESFQYDEALFRKMYTDGATYAEIAEKLGCGTGTVTNIRRRLGLPNREPKPRVDIDLHNLVKKYNLGATHAELCEEFGISLDTLKRKIRKLGLQRRRGNNIPKIPYDVDEFKEAWRSGISCPKIAEKFGIDAGTVSWRARKLGLPLRKHPSSLYNEEEFRKAYEAGLSIRKMVEKFKISQNSVYLHIRELGLSRENKKTTEPDTTKPVSKHIVTLIEPVVAVIEPKISDRRSTFILPPTLRQLEKEQNNIAMQRAKRNYMIMKKENGFSSLIAREIDNPLEVF